MSNPEGSPTPDEMDIVEKEKVVEETKEELMRRAMKTLRKLWEDFKWREGGSASRKAYEKAKREGQDELMKLRREDPEGFRKLIEANPWLATDEFGREQGG